MELERVVREGNGTPLQYSCLENPMDGRTWWAAVHGIAKSRTWLSGFTLSLFTFMHWRRKWQPTPVLLPGKSHGWKNLVGYSPWGRKESDTTERLHLTSSLKKKSNKHIKSGPLQGCWGIKVGGRQGGVKNAREGLKSLGEMNGELCFDKGLTFLEHLSS